MQLDDCSNNRVRTCTVVINKVHTNWLAVYVRHNSFHTVSVLLIRTYLSKAGGSGNPAGHNSASSDLTSVNSNVFIAPSLNDENFLSSWYLSILPDHCMVSAACLLRLTRKPRGNRRVSLPGKRTSMYASPVS